MYNVNEYLQRIKGGIVLTFQSIFEKPSDTRTIMLEPKKDPSINLITEEPFYIFPQFNDLTTKKDAHIYVISAPGATGKSALAKYLAYMYSSIYWNLADITLGDNSFVGSLVRSVGTTNYSSFTKDLLSGRTKLVIDAFDEAEMISGARAVQSFLSEIATNTAEAQSPCVFLLSRAETAQGICAFFESIDTAFNHYEISFFEEATSIEFIMEIVKRNPISYQNPEIIHDCIVQYLKNIDSKIQQEDNLRSFTGYAPVLEVIGMHIAQETNAYSFLQSLQTNSMKGIEIIERILKKLLEREQDKVKEGFLRRIQSKAKDLSIKESNIYSTNEQLVQLVCYILFGSYDESFSPNCVIPDEYKDDYASVLNAFLPQHPFIRSTGHSFSFTGPAFRDYVIAKLMENKNNDDLIQLFFSEKRISNHFPSHLLWDFFTNKQDIIIPADKVSYLFESYRSQAKGKTQAFLTIGGCSKTGYSTGWTLCSDEYESNESYEMEIDGAELNLENLSNVSVDVDDLDVVVRNLGGNILISHCSVFSKKLQITGEHIVIDAFEPPCILVSNEDAIVKNYSGSIPDITINGDKLAVAFPNIKSIYKFIRYNTDYSDNGLFSIEKFCYILRKIFVQFRKHKKDTPARDAEKIDFLIIGNEEYRKQVFKFLTSNQIIYRDNPLYKINMTKLEEIGISWGAVTSSDYKQLQNAYDSFVIWHQSSVST